MMNENDSREGDNEATMEVENMAEYIVHLPQPPFFVQMAQPQEEIHPLALVAINVPNIETAHVENVPLGTAHVENIPIGTAHLENVHFETAHVENVPLRLAHEGNDFIVAPYRGNAPIVENDLLVEANSNNSSTPSAVSSRIHSPTNVEEESNQEPTSEIAHSSKKRTYEDNSSDDEGTMCSICLDNWTSTGDHRICSLKCGHLFGYKCVNEWLNRQRKATCPTCKKKAKASDIRYLYAKKLIAVDTTELDNIQKQLEKVIEERNKAQNDLAKYACREYMLTHEITHLKAQLDNYTRKSAINVSDTNYLPERVRFYMEKSMEVCKYGGSRVFDASCERDLLMASMKSTSNLFMGFGLKKINISNYKPLAFIPVHTLQIRDVCFHQENNWILTASMDKTFKVIDNNTNSVIHQFSHQMPLWSCCWDSNNPFILYVGTQSGSVIKYDVRHLNEPVSVLSIEGDMSPVVSVISIPACHGETLPQGGVVSCKLNSLWLYENIDNEYVRHAISLEGPFVSMKYQASTKQLLVSSRPNNRITYSRHTLCTLDKKGQEKIDCNIIHSFRGGGMQKLLSKSCFLSHTNDYVAAHQEDCRSVYLWSINTGEKVCSIPAHETVLDLKGLQNQNGSFLLSLTEKKLEFFKFI